jgi:hypothetical protein
MSEIVVETTPLETVIEIEGGPTLTTTVTQELQTVIAVPSEAVVIDLNSGARGEPGSAILTGEAYPTLLMGSVGDVFIVTEGTVGAGDVYIKTVLGWVKTGNIRGPAGGIDSVNGHPGPDVELTKADIGLNQADNTSDIDKPVSTAQQAALDALGVELGTLSDEVDTKQDFIVAGTVAQYWRGDKTWQTLDKDAAGLENVDNTSDADKPVSTAQQAALDLKANLESPTFTGTVAGITKSMVGLGNVDNTSDVNKPVSTAQANSIATKVGLTGDESIAGTKTFTGAIVVPAPTDPLHASTMQYVDDRVDAIIDTSPETLNTLNELAAALGDDPNFAATVTNSLASKVSLTGDQSIDGVKTFTSAPVVPDASFGIIKVNGLQAALDLKAPINSPTFTGTITGDGSGLTGLSGYAIDSGVIADEFLSGNVPMLNEGNTFTGRMVIASSDTGTLYSTAPLEIRQTSTGVPRISFHKTTVNAAQIRMTDAGNFEFANIGDTAFASISALNITATGTITGNGSGITTINGSNVSSGTVADARIATSIARLASPAFTGTPTAPTPATADNDTKLATTAFVKAALLASHPIGDIKVTTNSANPSTYIGGTWVAWGAGKVPVGIATSGTFNVAVETTGGAESSVLTSAHIPQHSHTISHSHSAWTNGGGGVDHLHYVSLGGGGHEHTYQRPGTEARGTGNLSAASFSLTGGGVGTSGGGGHGHEGWSGAADRSLDHNHSVSVGGTDTASSGTYGTASPTGVPILQPYIVCYMWKRTA